jgi:hypothetical protein
VKGEKREERERQREERRKVKIETHHLLLLCLHFVELFSGFIQFDLVEESLLFVIVFSLPSLHLQAIRDFLFSDFQVLASFDCFSSKTTRVMLFLFFEIFFALGSFSLSSYLGEGGREGGSTKKDNECEEGGRVTVEKGTRTDLLLSLSSQILFL